MESLHPPTAAGLSTRQIIDSASYTTTPSRTPPPPEARVSANDVFSAYDAHRKEPDVATLAAADRALEASARALLHERRTSSGSAYKEALAASAGDADGDGAASGLDQARVPARGPERGGFVPSYVLSSIVASENASAEARESARRTLEVDRAGGEARRGGSGAEGGDAREGRGW